MDKPVRADRLTPKAEGVNLIVNFRYVAFRSAGISRSVVIVPCTAKPLQRSPCQRAHHAVRRAAGRHHRRRRLANATSSHIPSAIRPAADGPGTNPTVPSGAGSATSRQDSAADAHATPKLVPKTRIRFSMPACLATVILRRRAHGFAVVRRNEQPEAHAEQAQRPHESADSDDGVPSITDHQPEMRGETRAPCRPAAGSAVRAAPAACR